MTAPRRLLDANERRDWLRLSRTERVGPVTFRQLLRRFGSAARALEVLPELSRRGGSSKPLVPCPLRQVEEELAALAKKGGVFVASCEPGYPEPLAAIEDAPPLLAVLGHPGLLGKRSLGIVGARNASLNGRKMAEKLAQDLGAQGFVIVSGLARGIDAAAHQAALGGGTVAVLAGGVDVVYPEENRALYDRIVEAGAVISDQPLSCEPRAQLFPRRNRLISGLSLGVIVVEAAKQSGSLITARMALEQGREVFAVPGSPLDPRAGGSNDLLRQGAVLTETAEDVTRHIFHMPQRLAEGPAEGFEPFEPPPVDEALLPGAREAILEALGYAPVAVDDLVRRCGFPAPVVLTVLLELELAGRVERLPGHQVVLLA